MTFEIGDQVYVKGEGGKIVDILPTLWSSGTVRYRIQKQIGSHTTTFDAFEDNLIKSSEPVPPEPEEFTSRDGTRVVIDTHQKIINVYL